MRESNHSATPSSDHPPVAPLDPMDPMDAIVVESLTKRYGNLLVVDDLSFTVRRGELFAFLGPNGAGKSTTVEIIETIRAPTSGRVRVLGMDVTRQKRDIVQRIGVLPQGFSSFDRITVRETIQYYARLFSRRGADVEGLMDLADLRDKRDVQFRHLSGGMKQRLGIAIALVNDPEIVLLDEPTTGLDPHARRAVWDVLLGLKRRGTLVFLTTHSMEEAEVLADTVAIIAKGRLVAIGSPNQLIARHATHMDLTVFSADSRARDSIRRLGFRMVTENEGVLRIQVKATDDLEAILVALKQPGRSLPTIELRRPTLEAVFLRLTGNHGTDPASPDGGVP